MNSDYTLIWGEYEDLELQGSIFFNHKTHMEKIVFDDGFGEIIFEVDEPTGTSLVRFLNFDTREVKRLKANVLNSVINFLDNETLYDIAIRLDVVDIFDDNDALKEIIDLLKIDKVANTSSKGASVFLYDDLIRLPNDMIELLKEYRAEQSRTRLLMGDQWHNSGKVFTDETGGSSKSRYHFVMVQGIYKAS